MTDQIIRDLPLIRRYARENETEDLSFRKFLKVGLDMPNTVLDTLVQTTTNTVWSQIDCTTCGNCCRTLQIVVDDRDIRRLGRRLGMTTRGFVERHVGVAEDGTTHLKAVPCPFLGADNRCAVYEDRPRACRDFPYLHTKGFRARTYAMIDNLAVCPIVFNVWEALKTLTGFRPESSSRP